MRNAMWVGGGITGMGEIPMLGVKEKGIAKVIRDIFRNGEQGFFYDPSDMGTMYQGASGTPAVKSAGQPVGLVMDKSKGLAYGDETISNGNFEGGLIGSKVDSSSSSSTWELNTVSPISGTQDGKLTITTSAGGRPFIDFGGVGKKVGEIYEISFDYKVTSGSIRILGLFNGSVTALDNSTLDGVGKFTARVVRIGSDSRDIVYFGDSVGTIQIDNFSVKRILGNHALQSTSAARPIFRHMPILGSELVLDGTILGNPATGVIQFYETVGKIPLLTAGKTYLISYTVSKHAGGVVGLAGVNPPGLVQFSQSRNGTFSTTVSVTAPGYLKFYTREDATANFTNISVKEITGYRTDINCIEHDGVDDKLVTNLPTTLTNATVLRAVPGVGTQVKYNQMLPMLYENSTNHSGLIAIDRALTRTEQLRLMNELDKRAGATSLETLTFKAFDDNQEGFVYDPNDLSTLFQDSVGINPVTSIGQPVGLILDKSKGLVLGSNQISYPNSEELPASVGMIDGAYTWTLNDDAPISGTQDSRLIVTVPSLTTTRPSLYFLCSSPLIPGKLYKFSFRYKVNSGVPRIAAVHKGDVAAIVSPDKGTLQGSGTFDIVIRWIAGSQNRPYLYFSNGSVFDLQINDISVREVKGNHAFQDNSASRPILRQNAVTGANYLEFDGSDDFLQTANIDFTGTDKVSLFVGMQMRSVVSIGCLVNFGRYDTSNKGIFHIRAPQDSGVVTTSLYTIGSSNTRALAISNAVELGKNFVLSANSYTNPEKSVVKINGGDTIEHDSADSTGNFGMYPLYIGRFGGTTHAFNGHVYSLIGIGKLVSDTETIAIEKELAKRVGVTLNV